MGLSNATQKQRFINIFWVRPGACERISGCFALVGKSFSCGLERSSASLCPPHGLLSVGRALRSLGSRPVLFCVLAFFSVYDCPPNFAFLIGESNSWVLAVVAVNRAEVFLGDAFSLVRHLHFPTLSAVVAFVNKVNFPVAHFCFLLCFIKRVCFMYILSHTFVCRVKS